MLGDSDIRPDLGRLRKPSLDGRSDVALVERANPYNLSDSTGMDVGDASGAAALSHYWRLLVKHRWVVIGCLMSALIVGVAVTLLMTPVYRATITLQIDREAAKVVSTQVEPSDQMVAGEEFFQTQYGLLKSRSLAARVVDSLNLAANDNFLHAMGVRAHYRQGTAGDLSSQRRQLVLNTFQKNLGVAPVRGSRLVDVTFTSPDPETAALIANSIGSNFIKSILDRRMESSSYARDFLKDQMDRYRDKLEDSERQLVAYAQAQQIVNIPTGTDTNGASGNQSLMASSLQQLNTALATAQGERIKTEQRWRQSQLALASGLPEVLQNPTIQDLTQTRAKLEAEYQDKSKIFRPDFPDMVELRARLDSLDAQIKTTVQNIQNSLKVQYDVALAQEKSFNSQVSGLKSGVLDLRGRSIQYDIYQREVETNRELYNGLLARYKEIGIAGGVTSNNVSIIDRAERPTKPAKPRPLINLAIAAALGLTMGIGLALLIELLDESIGSPEDVESKIGLPLLGSVPKLNKGELPLEAMRDIRSPLSEAYYSIRTALQFSTATGAPSSLLVTSARPAEGKSTTALAIAQSFARIGMRVLLIDGDLRNPSMHRNLSADNSIGFSNLLTGSAQIAQIVQSTDIEHLSFIPCGPLPPNPAELLAGGRLAAVLEEAKVGYDMVVIDGPPVLGLADAPLLAASLAGTVFVLESGRTRRGPAKIAVRRLHMGSPRILGAILTKFNAKKSAYGYAYAYSYEYGERPSLPKS
jgi:succinoglycan biosynthesis transport protein ExoP